VAKASLIFIIGPDGVGKTTHARLLERELRSRGIRSKYVWMRWNHKLSLPLLGLARLLKLSKVEQLQTGKKVVYHYFDRVRPIAVTYQYVLFIDTLVSIMFKIYTKLRKSKFVICDRSPYDTLIDLMISTRNPKLLGSFIAKLFLLLVGDAISVMLVVAHPDILKSRREDVHEDRDLDLKIKLYNSLLSNFRVLVLNAEEPIDKVHSNLMKIVSGFIDETR